MVPKRVGTEKDMVPKRAGTKKDMVPKRAGTEKDLVPKRVGIEKDPVPKRAGTEKSWYRMALTESVLYRKVPDRKEKQPLGRPRTRASWKSLELLKNIFELLGAFGLDFF